MFNKPCSVLSHFQLFKRLYLNTGQSWTFHGSNKVDWRNIYFLKITHLGTDQEAKWFLKPRSKLGFVLRIPGRYSRSIYVVLNYYLTCESRQLSRLLFNPPRKECLRCRAGRRFPCAGELLLLLIEICTAQFLWKYSTAPYIENWLKMEN